MSVLLTTAYTAGAANALEVYAVTKEAGWLQTTGRIVGKGAKYLGRATGMVPGVGTLAGAAIGGVGGAIEGLSQGEGLKGALVRGGMGAATGAMPLGAGFIAGAAGDAMANKMLRPKPATGPATAPMPGMIHGQHLPGMVAGA